MLAVRLGVLAGASPAELSDTYYVALRGRKVFIEYVMLERLARAEIGRQRDCADELSRPDPLVARNGPKACHRALRLHTQILDPWQTRS